MKNIYWRQISLVLMALVIHQASALELTFTEDEELGDDVPYKTLIMNGIIGPRPDQSPRQADESADVRKLKSMLATQLKAGRRTVFMLSSEGGVLEVAEELASAILAHAKHSYAKTKLPDLFLVNEGCGSACTVLTSYLTKNANPALQFFVHGESAFFFHAPTMIVENGRVVRSKDHPLMRKRELEKLLGIYRSYGVSEKWLASHKANFESLIGFPTSALELCKNSARVIPPGSCSRLSSDRFNELIDEVYSTGGDLGRNIELLNSLQRPKDAKEVFKINFQIWKAFLGIA